MVEEKTREIERQTKDWYRDRLKDQVRHSRRSWYSSSDT